MSKSVYLETTIPSAYFDERDDIVSGFQRYQTRLWWNKYRDHFAEINRRLGLITPTILTPQMLVEEDSDGF